AVVYDGFDWQIGTFSDHLYRPLAYAVPLGILIAVYKWRAEKEGKQRTHNYFIEKLGATFTVPIAFLIISIVLELIERSTYIHAWFSSMAYTFIYDGIFLVIYFIVFYFVVYFYICRYFYGHLFICLSSKFKSRQSLFIRVLYGLSTTLYDYYWMKNATSIIVVAFS